MKLSIYDLIIKPIRDQDRQEGLLFLQRLLQGAQEVWQDITSKIDSIKDLWSVDDCPDGFLQYLKWIVGWTKELDHITKNLDAATLRRLISVSVPMWKRRSTETSIIDLLSTLVPARSRIWSWFELRWILDTDFIGLEEWRGRDPWILGPDDPYWMNVRIVDNPAGTINRQLLKDVLNLMRPSGERFEIVFLRFLDLFEVDGDLSQWQEYGGTLAISPVVEEGLLKLLDTTQQEGLCASVEGADDWGDTGGVMVTARIRWQTGGDWVGPGLMWHLDPDLLNGYYVQFDPGRNYLLMGKITGGTPSSIADTDLDPLGITLEADRWYCLRVQCVDNGVVNVIKIFLDGEEIIDTTDATYDQGNIALWHTINADGEYDEIEVMPLPVEIETVEINY